MAIMAKYKLYACPWCGGRKMEEIFDQEILWLKCPRCNQKSDLWESVSHRWTQEENEKKQGIKHKPITGKRLFNIKNDCI